MTNNCEQIPNYANDKRLYPEKKTSIEKLDMQKEKQLKESEVVLDAELLSTIPGVGKEGVSYLLAAIGNNMKQFPDEQYLASWAVILKSKKMEYRTPN